MDPEPKPRPQPPLANDDDDDNSLREWTIGVCVALLSLFASWIVFGEDLTHLVQAPAGPASTAAPSVAPKRGD